jgi:hypothetical protein
MRIDLASARAGTTGSGVTTGSEITVDGGFTVT